MNRNFPKVCMFFISLCFLISNNINAQEHRIQRRKIKVNQNNTLQRTTPTLSSQLLVTAEPLKIISGEFPVGIMYSPADWIVFDAMMGVTWDNYYQRQRDGILAEFISEDIYPDFDDPSINPSFLLGAKFFPYSDAFDDGQYYGLQYTFREYSGTINPQSVEALEVGATFHDFSLIYGYQYLVETNKLLLDGYCGFALRYYETQSADMFVDPATNSFIPQPEEYEGITFSFLVGVKVSLFVL